MIRIGRPLTLVAFGVMALACSGATTTDDAAGANEVGTARSLTTAAAPRSTVAGADSEPAPPIPAAASQCDGSAATGPITVAIWHNFDAQRVLPLFETWVTEFEQEHPGVDIDLQAVQGGESALAALEMVPAVDLPDAVLLPDELTAQAIESGRFTAVDGCGADWSGLLPAVRTSYQIGGRLWAAPVTTSVPLLFFDRDAFRAAGLDPDAPPATLDDVASAARRIVESGAASYGLVLETGPRSGGAWYVEQTLAQAGTALLGESNGRSGAASAVHWNDPQTVHVLEVLQSLVEDGVAVVVDASDGVADLVRLIAPDDAGAMTIHTSGSLGSVLDLMADAPDRVGVAPLPALAPGAHASGFPGGSALWLVDGGSDDELAAARAWAAFLSSPRVQAELSAATGYVPATASAFDERALIDAGEEWPQLLVGGRALAGAPSAEVNVAPLSTRWADIRAVLADAVRSVLVDGAEPAGALAGAEAAAARLLPG